MYFRLECEKLRRELVVQREEDKRAAMEQLGRLKDEEAQAIRQGWERKMGELLQEVRGKRAGLGERKCYSEQRYNEVGVYMYYIVIMYIEQ